jgi:hypothetical protein
MYGSSYWNGEGFGSLIQSIKYDTKAFASKASVEQVKKWMRQNRDGLVFYPNYGLPYVLKLDI